MIRARQGQSLALAVIATALSVDMARGSEPSPGGGSLDGGGQETSGYVGLFGRLTQVDREFDNEIALGAGIRAGWIFARDWALEADVSLNAADLEGSDYFFPIHARLLRQWGIGTARQLHLGAGFVHFQSDGDVGNTGQGVSFLAGLDQALDPRTTLRLDISADGILNVVSYQYAELDGFPSEDTTGDTDWYVYVELGLQHAFWH